MSALRLLLLLPALLLNACTHVVSVVVAERSDQFVEQTSIGRLIEDGNTIKLEKGSSGELDELEKASRTYREVTGSEFFKNKKVRVLRLIVDRERDSMVFELSNCEYFSIGRQPVVKESEAKRIVTSAGDFALVESGIVARCAR